MPSSNKLKTCGRRRACWLDAHGELLYRASIPESQTYDHNRAYELIAKVKSVKPIVRCKVQCVSDALRLKKTSTFGSTPPRRVYLYRDIQRFYSFCDHPTILILGCNDQERKSRSYEYFKLEEGSVKEICDLINRAHSHPLCILVNDDNSLVRYHSSLSSLAGESERYSNPADTHGEAEPITDVGISATNSNGDLVNEADGLLEDAEPIEAVQNFSQPDYPDNQIEHGIIEEVKCEELNYQPMENHVAPNSPIPRHLRSDPLFEKLCQNVREDEVWAVDMKYIDMHPLYGNEIATRGATYMFVAHHKYPEYGKMYQIEEEPSSIDAEGQENTADVSFTTVYVNQ